MSNANLPSNQEFLKDIQRCPTCGSDELEYFNYDDDPDCRFVYQPVHCMKCEAEYYILHKAVGYTMSHPQNLPMSDG